MKKPIYSPLKAVEDIFYLKVKDTPFKVWHYYVALAFLTVIPTLISMVFQSNNAVWAMYIVVAIAWLSSRTIGQSLSRQQNLDSVLVYRFFALTPWLITLVSTGLVLSLQKLSELDHLLYTGFFWLSLFVALMHILGIIIHLKKKPAMVKNIKKTDLFQ